MDGGVGWSGSPIPRSMRSRPSASAFALARAISPKRYGGILSSRFARSTTGRLLLQKWHVERSGDALHNGFNLADYSTTVSGRCAIIWVGLKDEDRGLGSALGNGFLVQRQKQILTG